MHHAGRWSPAIAVYDDVQCFWPMWKANLRSDGRSRGAVFDSLLRVVGCVVWCKFRHEVEPFFLDEIFEVTVGLLVFRILGASNPETQEGSYAPQKNRPEKMFLFWCKSDSG